MEQSRIDSLLAFSIEASRNRLPVNQLDSLRCLPGDHDAVYLKRILFARSSSRFERAALETLLSEQETIHDIPVDGCVIQRGQPVCTIIRRIERNAKDPMRRHRVLMSRLHAAVKDRGA